MWPISGYIGGAALLLGVLGGWTVRDWKADAEVAEIQDQLNKAKDKAQVRYDNLSERYEAQRATMEPAKENTRTLIKEVYRNAPPVPAACIPPADAVSLLDAAIAAVNATEATGEFGRSMPSATKKAKPVR